MQRDTSHTFCDPVLRVQDHGTILLKNYGEDSKDVKVCYLVSPQYEMDMTEYLKDQRPLQKCQTVVEIATQLLTSFRLTHKAGYVYNDLKPENIMISLESGIPKVTLIDFGLATRFKLKGSCNHINENEMTKSFNGNMLHSSVDAMNFFKTSRKDDLISLFYLLVSQMNDGNLVGYEEPKLDEL